MAHPVKWYSEEMTGIPQLTRLQGELTTLLDAVLVNGFNIQTVQSITRSGTNLTVTFAAPHGFILNQVVLIQGANESAFNDEFRVVGVSSLSFVATVPDTGPLTATGTISCRAAPLGWFKVYSGTNKAVYRSQNPLSNQHLLRVDNNMHSNWAAGHAAYGTITCATTMTDVDTITGEYFPSRSDLPALLDGGFCRWFYAVTGNALVEQFNTVYPASSANKFFRIIGDDRCLHFGVKLSQAGSAGTFGTQTTWYAFGDFKSYRAADGFNTFMIANERIQNGAATSTAQTTAGTSSQPSYGFPHDARLGVGEFRQGKLLFKNYTQYGLYSNFGEYTVNPVGTFISNSNTGIVFPNTANNGIIIHPIYMFEVFSNAARGEMPGKYVIGTNALTNLIENQIIDNVVNFGTKKFIFFTAANGDVINTATSSTRYNITGGSGFAFDLDGPWEY